MAEAGPRTPYWPEIDGLRTLAVLAVIVFHFERSWLPGGFAGVDVFFVISGFLISAILLRELDARRFSILGFYQRRIARIAPAALLVIAATLIAARLIYSEQEFSGTGEAAAWAAISAINIKLMFGSGYFVASPDAEPLLHYWSLAVEEQFYLLFPFFLYAAVRWTGRPLAITLIAALASLALCIWGISHRPSWAFYLLPMRAWELFAGVVLAMLHWRGVQLRERLVPWLGWGGLGAVAFALVLPAAIPLVAVLGTAAMLRTAGAPSRLNRLLGHPLPVAIGKRSYALYLWHWPVFSFVDYQYFSADAWFRAALKIALVVALSWLSYALVERPARRLLNRPEWRWPAYGGFVLAAAALFALGMQFKGRAFSIDAANNIARGGWVAGQGERNVVLAGDSQAAVCAPELGRLARERGFTLHLLAVPLVGRHHLQWPDLRAFVERSHADVVILAELWYPSLDPARRGRRHTRGRPVDWGLAVDNTLRDLKAMGVPRLVMVLQPPVPEADRGKIRGGQRPPYLERPSERRLREKERGHIEQIIAGRAEILDLAPLFLLPDGSIDLVSARGRMHYLDAEHLSSEGCRRALPLYDRAISKALAQRR